MIDDDNDALAGEYVLGLLSAEDRAFIERTRASDRELDAAIARWEARLQPLGRAVTPVEPDPNLWGRIAGTLWAPPAAEIVPAPAASRPLSFQQGTLRRWWGSMPFWRGAGLVGAAAAVALAVTTYLAPPGLPPVPVAVSVLEDQTNQTPGWLVEVFDDGTSRVLPLVATDVPADRALQLWTLRDPAEGPISLGLVPAGEGSAVSLGELLPVSAGQLFEISVEPPTGSPTGRPTGPVLFIGRAAIPPGQR